MKLCIRCGLKKDLLDFYIDRRRKDGHVSVCKCCLKINSKKQLVNEEVVLRFRKNNPNYFIAKSKEFRKNNPNYFLDNKENYIIASKKYKENNKEHIKNIARAYQINRRLNDPLYKLSGNLRNLIKNSFNNKGFRKSSKTENIIGCSFKEVKIFLEDKFEDWMSFENYGKYNGEYNYGWDIDHITPLSSAKNEDELIKLSHYTNLQPLCSYTNRHIKKNNYLHEKTNI